MDRLDILFKEIFIERVIRNISLSHYSTFVTQLYNTFITQDVKTIEYVFRQLNSHHQYQCATDDDLLTVEIRVLCILRQFSNLLFTYSVTR